MPLWPAAFLAATLVAAVPSAHAQGAAASLVQAGRCTGGAGPEQPLPRGGNPVDLRRDPSLKEAAGMLWLNGYREDEKTGRLLGPRGEQLTDAGLAFLLAPADFSRERVAAQFWSVLTHSYRLDEARCVMDGPQGKPLTRLEYYAQREHYKFAVQHAALETLAARLGKLPPGAPVPADVTADMKALAAADRGLPPDLQRLIDKGGLSVAALSKTTLQDYAAYTRFFDNQRSLGSLVEGALPPVEGLTVHRLPAYSEPEEKRLGSLLRADLERKFSQTGAGRDILRRLSDKSGRPDLPPILLLKVTQRPEDGFALAFYNDQDRAVTMNHWTAVSSLLERLPPGERERRAREFADPRKLRDYLDSHPKERAELLDGIDDIFYHEFIHAWQARRDGLSLENLRGNVGHAYPLEWELEAFREECRYDIVKAAADPLALTRVQGGPEFCLGMVKSFDSWEDSVKLLFNQQSVRGNGAASLPDIRVLQRTRESMARRLMDDSLFQRAVQALKLQGMLRADEKIDDLARGDAKRKRRFIAERLPELRALAARLPGQLFDLDRPDLAVRVLKTLPASTPGLETLEERAYKVLAPRLARPDKAFPLDERLASYGALRGLGGNWAPDVWGAYWRDAALEAKALRSQAKSSTGETARDAAAAAAQWEAVAAGAPAEIAKLRASAAKMKDARQRSDWLTYADRLESQRRLALRQASAGGVP